MPSNKNRQGLCTHGRRPVPFPCYARPDITLDSCLDPVVSICARPLPPVTYTQKESNSFSSNLYCFPDFPLMACLTCVLRATAHNYDKVLRQPGEAGGQHFYWHSLFYGSGLPRTESQPSPWVIVIDVAICVGVSVCSCACKLSSLSIKKRIVEYIACRRCFCII